MTPQTAPAIAITYDDGANPAFLERVIPLVDYLEVTPDSIARSENGSVSLDKKAMRQLKALGPSVKIVVHGVGLSIGSHDGYNEDYIRLLDSFMEQIDVAWHSEHLAYTTVDGQNLGTMLALPKTEQVLDMVSERVGRIQRRYKKAFLLENVVHLLPDIKGDYSEAGFLNSLVERTGCGLLLDIYNLECDARNHGLDIPQFLRDLRMQDVRELHLAQGVEHKGFLLDVHSGLLRDSTIALAHHAVELANGAIQLLTYELLAEAVPVLGHEAIAEELARLREQFSLADQA